MPSLLIRAFEPRDREPVIALHQALNRHEQMVTGDRALSYEDAQACLRDDELKMAEHGGVALIADVDGTVAGYLCCIVVEGGPYLRADLRRSGHVTTLVVDQDHRRLGIARRLLGEAERYTREQGLPSLSVGVLTGNAAAEELYRRFGFAPYAVEMVKRL